MAQLKEEQRLVADLIATGTAILSHRAVATAPLTGREHIATTDPVERLLVTPT